MRQSFCNNKSEYKQINLHWRNNNFVAIIFLRFDHGQFPSPLLSHWNRIENFRSNWAKQKTIDMMKKSKMGHDNHAISDSTVTLHMPQEPRGSYRGSNEFICKYSMLMLTVIYWWQSLAKFNLDDSFVTHYSIANVIRCQSCAIQIRAIFNISKRGRKKNGTIKKKSRGTIYVVAWISVQMSVIRLFNAVSFRFICVLFTSSFHSLKMNNVCWWCCRYYSKMIAIEFNSIGLYVRNKPANNYCYSAYCCVLTCDRSGSCDVWFVCGGSLDVGNDIER